MMKQIITSLFVLLSVFTAHAQFRMVGSGTWTTENDSTYSGTINFQADLTGQGYLPTQIAPGFRLFTPTEQLYRVDQVVSSTFSTAEIVIVEVGSTTGQPIGQAMIFNPDGRETIPQVPFGSTGSTAQMQAAVDSWNARVDAGGAGNDTWLGSRLANGNVSISESSDLELATDQIYLRTPSLENALIINATNALLGDVNAGFRTITTRSELNDEDEIRFNVNSQPAVIIDDDKVDFNKVLELHKTAIPPDSTDGSMYYDIGDNEYKIFKDGEWAGMLSPSSMSREGASNNDAIRWDGTKWAPAPVNSFEFVDTVFKITVCNNTDTCFTDDLGTALQEATRFKAVYDTSNANTRIEIILRPNPNGDPILWNKNEQFKVTGGDYSGIVITSNWQDSIYEVVFDSITSLAQFTDLSNLKLENLHITNITGSGSANGFRFTRCSGVVLSNLTIDSFRNSINHFYGTLFLNSTDIREAVNNGLWNQNGFVTIVGGEIINSSGTGVNNRGVIVTRSAQVFNNSINVRNDGSFVAGENLFANDTITGNQHVASGGGSYVGGGLTYTDGELNIPVNKMTKDGFIIDRLAPYNFEVLATAPDARENGYYYNTLDSVPYWSDGSNWYKLPGISGLLPKDNQYINAKSHSLAIDSLAGLALNIDSPRSTFDFGGLPVIDQGGYSLSVGRYSDKGAAVFGANSSLSDSLAVLRAYAQTSGFDKKLFWASGNVGGQKVEDFMVYTPGKVKIGRGINGVAKATMHIRAQPEIPPLLIDTILPQLVTTPIPGAVESDNYLLYYTDFEGNRYPIPGIPGLLPLDTVDIDANQNRLQITNTSNTFFTATDGSSNTQTFQLSPTAQKSTIRAFDATKGSRLEVGLDSSRMLHSGPSHSSSVVVDQAGVKIVGDTLYAGNYKFNINQDLAGKTGHVLTLDSTGQIQLEMPVQQTLEYVSSSSGTDISQSIFDVFLGITQELRVGANIEDNASSDMLLLIPGPVSDYAGKKMIIAATDEDTGDATEIVLNGDLFSSAGAVTSYTMSDNEIIILTPMQIGDGSWKWVIK